MSSYSRRRFQPQTGEEIEKVRQNLRNQYGGTYDQLQQILFEIDSHDLNYGDNYNEYERVVWEALPELRLEQSDEEIGKVIEAALNRVLDEPLSNDASGRVRAAAPRIRKALVR